MLSRAQITLLSQQIHGTTRILAAGELMRWQRDKVVGITASKAFISTVTREKRSREMSPLRDPPVRSSGAARGPPRKAI